MYICGHKIDLKWNGHVLYLKGRPYADLVEHIQYHGMYYIKWTKGYLLSADFYNLTRAKQHALRFAVKDTQQTTHTS